jgi:hypothetical protein
MPSMIGGMIRDLPSHSRLAVRRSFQVDDGEVPDLPDVEGLDEALRYAEARRWNQQDQEIGALIVNALWRLYEAVPSWEKGKRPEMPTMGPRSWWPDKQKAEHRKKLRQETNNSKQEGNGPSVMEVMAGLGFTGGK